MAVTPDQISTMRRLVAEATDTTYTDALIASFVEARAVPDARGVEPFVLDAYTTPPTLEANPAWIPTYDLNGAAADIWEEKAAAVAACYTFQADGASYQRSNLFDQYMRQAQRCRSRAVPGKMKFTSTQRERTSTGVVVEAPILIDTIYEDEAVNE